MTIQEQLETAALVLLWEHRTQELRQCQLGRKINEAFKELGINLPDALPRMTFVMRGLTKKGLATANLKRGVYPAHIRCALTPQGRIEARKLVA